MEANLVPLFERHPLGVQALKDIKALVRSQFDDNWSATENYRKQMANDWKVFVGDLPEKEGPFADLANAHVPVNMETISRLAFRVYGELFGDPWHVFDVVPVGPGDDAAANILSVHGNWQFREQIPDFQRQAHRAVLAFFQIGDVTAHSWYDEHRKVNRHEILTPDQFLTPYAITTTMPDYSDLPWYAKICPMYRHELESYRGAWSGLDELLKGEAPRWDSDPDQPMATAAAKIHNIEPASEQKDTPYKIIWWEGWLDLPEQNRQRFCKVIFDHESGNILQLAVHEQWDWQEKIRFEREMAELEQFRAARAQHQAMVMQKAQNDAQQAASMAAASDAGMLPPGAAEQALEALRAQSMQPLPPPPPPPQWMKDPDDPDEIPEEPRYVPIRMFAHAVCIEPFFGNLGIGYGRVESDINRAINTLLSQFIDTASLSNVPSFLAAQGVEIEGGDLNLGPGKVNRIMGVAAADLSNAIVPLKLPPGNPQMVQMAELLFKYSESAVQAPNILSGASGKSGETAREWSGRLEQATKQLTVVSDKLMQFFVQIFKNNAALNAQFLKEEELIQVTNHLRQGEQILVTRAMYERNYALEFRADLKFTSRQQKVQEADEAFAMAMRMPQLQMNPAFMYYVTKKMFEARNRRDLVQLMGPPPPPSPIPFGMPPPPPPGAGPGGPPPGPPNGPPGRQ